MGRLSGNSDLGFVFGLFGAVFLLVVPVHKDILSILLVISIAISLLILLTVIYVKDPPEFSVFPTLLDTPLPLLLLFFSLRSWIRVRWSLWHHPSFRERPG